MSRTKMGAWAMGKAGAAIQIDRQATAQRVADRIATLSSPPFSDSAEAVCRYAYTPGYLRTVDYLAGLCEEAGLTVSWDPIGTLVARNAPSGEPVLALGSHGDSVRAGGGWDGMLGVLAAIEVCALAREFLPGVGLQVISFVEEEGAGFGRTLLGSSLMTGRLSDRELRKEIRSIDDGRSLLEHAAEAGYESNRCEQSERALDDALAWIELHIEQGRALQETGARLGVVSAIAGYVHADLTVRGRSDHAGATPMDLRFDPALPAAETVVELERLALQAGAGTVATVGAATLAPGEINVVACQADLTLDIRGPHDAKVAAVAADARRFAAAAARRRGMEAEYHERSRVAATPLDERVRAALTAAAERSGAPHRSILSGAAHDTMNLANRVPSGMLFIPCRDGISHSPRESADPTDAALAVEVMLNAVAELTSDGGRGQ